MWLLLKDPNDRSDRVAFSIGEELIVGRGKECNVVILDALLSRKHLAFSFDGEKVEVRDLGSSSGTQVDSSPIKGSCQLSENSIVTAGNSSFCVAEKLPKPAAKKGKSELGVDIPKDSLERLRKAREPKELLQLLLDVLVALFGADHGFVLLRQEQNGPLVTVAQHALPDAKAFVSVSSTVYNRAIEQGERVFVHDTRMDDECQRALTFALSDAPRSILCHPLRIQGGDVFGVIYLDMPLLRSEPDETTLELLETFSALAAERLASFRVRKSLLAARNRLEAMDVIAWEGNHLVHGDGEAAHQLREHLDNGAKVDTTIFVFGETGTGKEMVARAIHRMSQRKNGPFVPVNCAALSADLIEAELFGAEKGAYTGATEQRKGRFELAQGGTLFLDEVGELPLEFQVKLLRVLQERNLRRVGGAQEIALDFRLICATNRDVEEAVRAGEFRADLFYRINVFKIELKPLRERKEDILPLARHFLNHFAARFSRKLVELDKDAEELLQTYSWPGNIRELRNAMERAVVVEKGNVVTTKSLPLFGPTPLPQDHSAGPTGGVPLVDGMPAEYTQAREIFEQAFIERSLKVNRGNISAVVRETGLARPTVYRWLEKFGLSAKDF